MAAASEQALVSVVTPFHNTAPYLRECIESVLKQTYGNFEYVLHDNASTDGSSEIASEYAARDPRVRLMRTEALLPQIPNYNRALTHIAPQSRYCKMVQADDWLFPECLERMVAVAESNPRIGLVSSLRFDGESVKGAALTYKEVVLNGRGVARFHLLGNGFLFGTPSTVMFRSDVVRGRRPFYEENRFQEDTEACYEILRDWDFGFVHQVLSYSRVEPDSLFFRMAQQDSVRLGRLILTHRYGPEFLTAAQFRERWHLTRAEYYRSLAKALFEMRGREYWHFHREGLRSERLSLELGPLAWNLALEALDVLGNPKATLRRLFRALFGR
jgi:glycosyltransferase involved in cell wall biosynthesis